MRRLMSKKRPHHEEYIRILRRLTPLEKIEKMFELSRLGNDLFLAGLRARHADLAPDKLHSMFLAQLNHCHNKNY